MSYSFFGGYLMIDFDTSFHQICTIFYDDGDNNGRQEIQVRKWVSNGIGIVITSTMDPSTRMFIPFSRIYFVEWNA